MSTFGSLLRTYRQECRDPDTGKPLSQGKLADRVYEETGLSYSGSTYGNWERGDTQIDKENRLLLLGFLRIFVKCRAIEDLAAANEFLEFGKFSGLKPDEILRVNPSWNEPAKKLRRKALNKDKKGETAIDVPGSSKAYPFMSPPIPPQGVVGRKSLIADILERLVSQSLHSESAPPVGLLGFGGIGKTTLAIAISHHPAIQENFPDGVFWAALGPQPQTRYLLERWGRELGLELLLERNERECSERLRNAFHGRRALIVVDDIWEVKNSQHFFVAGPKSRTLFTTREGEPANLLTTRKNHIRVDFLDDKNALDLLRQLAPSVVNSDKTSAQELCRRLGNLPLAITLAGRLLAVESDVPGKMQRVLAELVEHHQARLNLLQQEGRLGIDEENPVSLQAVLGMSVERLERIDKERFAMLAVFGGEPLSWELSEAQHIWECTKEEAEDSMHKLILRGLVEPRKNGEYGMHALLADYAEELRSSLKL